MYQNILIPVAPDHSGQTQEAIRVAKSLQPEGGRITLLSALDRIPAFVTQYLPEGQLEQNHKTLQAKLIDDAKDADNVKVHILGQEGSAGHTIVEYAKSHEIDLIIISSHRPELQDYFLGSTAARVVRHANCAVFVIR